MRRQNTAHVTGPEIIAAADCEQLSVLRAPHLGGVAILAVHDTRAGPAFGGIRRHRYPDLATAARDAVSLARAMTWKCALAELPAGGAKMVLLDADLLQRGPAYRWLGRHVEAMGGRYYTGPDVGTDDHDLLAVAADTRFVARPDAAGPGDLGASTARGVFAALGATAAAIGREVDGLRVAVQGLGAVGLRLARLLRGAGARLLVADLDGERAAAAARELDAAVLAPDAIVTADCDVLAPCAFGGVLHQASAAAVRAAAVCGAANNVLADAATGQLLHRRGVLVAPDFVANAGALIHGALFHLTGAAPPPARIDRIGEVTAELLAAARAASLPPGEVALQRAEARLAALPPGPWFPPRTRS